MNALSELTGGWLHDAAFTALFFDAWLKSLAVLAVAGGLGLCCRRAAAATRHWIWFLALASLPCLLLFSALPHAWQRPLWSVSTGFNSGNEFSLALDLVPAREPANPAPLVPPAGTVPAGAGEVRAGSRQPVAAHFSATLLVLGVLVWLAGIVVGLLSVLAGQVQLRRLARNGLFLATSDWALLLREACDQLRLRRPVRLLQSAENPIPLTWGWWRPVVLLPADAAHWPAERRRLVLLHELAHAKRWDCLTQTVARIVCALYWINPLVWLAARRMCVERERACDDLVLNSGCRASDYATHLVDIARIFRRTPQLAGIAMARSSQLQGRIAAIVDAARARQLRPFTALTILVLMGALALAVGGSSPGCSRRQTDDSVLRQQQIARLQSFAQAKEKQSRELAAKAGEQISPEFQKFFDAAIKGDWRTVTNRFAYYLQHQPPYTKGTNGMEAPPRAAYWQPVLELDLAYSQVINCDPKYTALLADGIINSIPAGSIYLGGTDAGRSVPTAFCKSSIEADPFFSLTQNAVTDSGYLNYLRAMYGGKIYIPTEEDSQRCHQEYLADAQRRLQENKLRPGEDVRMVDGKVQVSGHVAVIGVRGPLTKVIFDRNPDREFYVEESFPLDWMFPYLEPHGLIMKLNRQPLTQLPEETIARDHEYWRKLVAGMVGGWLDEKTPVTEIASFIDRIYVRHNLVGFTGDPRFVQNDYAGKIFCKLRCSIGGLYSWRFSPNAPPEYRPKSYAENQALVQEADFAFRQAFALCPSSPEAVFRYAQLLMQLHHWDDAILVAETCLKLDPHNGQVMGLRDTLQQYKKLSVGTQPAPANLRQLEEEVKTNPTNSQAALNLAGAYLQTQQTNRAIQVLDNLLEDPRVDSQGVLGAAQAYATMQNVPKLEAALERLVKVTPASPEAWYDLAVLKAGLNKSSEALAALKQALDLNAARLKRDPKARDLLQSARKEARFDALRRTPEFEKLVPPDQAKAERNLEAAREAVRLNPADAEAHNRPGIAPSQKGQIERAMPQYQGAVRQGRRSTPEAIRQLLFATPEEIQEALRLKPSNAEARNDPVPLLGKPAHTGPLTAAQAGALAEQLANAKAQALYKFQPFGSGPPAELVAGNWVWHDLRGHGSLDVDATVKFGADGTNPEVDVILLSNAPLR
jgi:beta-lactamase regulating signal transducer with metallopeptidase domain/tetratricopeptide (TPR) repeat protein